MEVQVTSDVEKGTTTIRYRVLRWYDSDGPWKQVTFPTSVFVQGMDDAKITVPWRLVVGR
jgi:uncharacterized protein YcfL